MYASEIGIRLEELLKNNDQVHAFVNELSKLTDIIFFGGSVRDLYFESRNSKPRDFDIVLSSMEEYKSIENLINQYEYRKNRFGGYKVLINDLELDIWYLENTWAFRSAKLHANEKNLMKSVYLSVDGVSYNYNKQSLYDDIFMKTDNNGIIDVILDENPHEELNLIRALVFKKQYEYNFSEQLINRFDYFNSANRNFADKLYYLQLDHYKHEILSYCEIESELKSMKRFSPKKMTNVS